MIMGCLHICNQKTAVVGITSNLIIMIRTACPKKRSEILTFHLAVQRNELYETGAHLIVADLACLAMNFFMRRLK